MWVFSSRRKRASEAEQIDKIASSQKILLDAAVSTADMAQHVTTKLKECLQDAIKQFESTIAIMSDALLICDIFGHIKACNPAASKIFGYDLSEIMKQSVLNLFRHHGSILSSPDELWSVLQPDMIQETIGFDGVHKTDALFPIEITLTRLGRADGSAVMLMLIKDMSDIMALKTESVANARRYRSLFELCFDGILVVQHDKVVAANRQAGKLFGCKAESLLRVEFTRLVNLEDRPKFDRIDELSNEPIEAGALRSDGTPLSLLFSVGEIMWNDDFACLITVRDMSTLAMLKQHRDNGIDMICCFDGDFRITFANDVFCRYYNVLRGNVVGSDVRTLMEESERNAFMLNIASLSPERPTRRSQIYAGKKRLQDWVDHAVFDSHGHIVEIQRGGRDITDLITEKT